MLTPNYLTQIQRKLWLNLSPLVSLNSQWIILKKRKTVDTGALGIHCIKLTIIAYYWDNGKASDYLQVRYLKDIVYIHYTLRDEGPFSSN